LQACLRATSRLLAYLAHCGDIPCHHHLNCPTTPLLLTPPLPAQQPRGCCDAPVAFLRHITWRTGWTALRRDGNIPPATSDSYSSRRSGAPTAIRHPTPACTLCGCHTTPSPWLSGLLWHNYYSPYFFSHARHLAYPFILWPVMPWHELVWFVLSRTSACRLNTGHYRLGRDTSLMFLELHAFLPTHLLRRVTPVNRFEQYRSTTYLWRTIRSLFATTLTPRPTRLKQHPITGVGQDARRTTRLAGHAVASVREHNSSFSNKTSLGVCHAVPF